MLVVGDLEDMFVPLSEGFLVDAWQSKCVADLSFGLLSLTDELYLL